MSDKKLNGLKNENFQQRIFLNVNKTIAKCSYAISGKNC